MQQKRDHGKCEDRPAWPFKSLCRLVQTCAWWRWQATHKPKQNVRIIEYSDQFYCFFMCESIYLIERYLGYFFKRLTMWITVTWLHNSSLLFLWLHCNLPGPFSAFLLCLAFTYRRIVQNTRSNFKVFLVKIIFINKFKKCKHCKYCYTLYLALSSKHSFLVFRNTGWILWGQEIVTYGIIVIHDCS